MYNKKVTLKDGNYCLAGKNCINHANIVEVDPTTEVRTLLPDVSTSLIPMILEPSTTNLFRLKQSVLNDVKAQDEVRKLLYCLNDLMENFNSYKIEYLYRKHFLENTNLSKGELLFFAGLNEKTVKNDQGNSQIQTVRRVALQTFDIIMKSEKDMFRQTYSDENIKLEFGQEFSFLINKILVARAKSISGGANSGFGKNIEKPICQIIFGAAGVSSDMQQIKSTLSVTSREVDFGLISEDGKTLNIEVKIVGTGNPENMDAAHSRDTNIVVAQHISEQHKMILEQNGVSFIELSNSDYPSQIVNALEKNRVKYTNNDLNISKIIEYAHLFLGIPK
jgi:hypothetical protein